jgi:hypothetical protein
MLVVRALKISQLTDGGMTSTHDSMHKALGAFFARQTIVNEGTCIGLPQH